MFKEKFGEMKGKLKPTETVVRECPVIPGAKPNSGAAGRQYNIGDEEQKKEFVDCGFGKGSMWSSSRGLAFLTSGVEWLLCWRRVSFSAALVGDALWHGRRTPSVRMNVCMSVRTLLRNRTV